MNNLIKIGLGLAIAIVFPFMTGFGIEAFYPRPEDPWKSCEQFYREPVPAATTSAKPSSGPDSAEARQCQTEAQAVTDAYNRDFFVLITVIGFVGLAIGTLLFKESMGPVGPGLVFGGLFAILYGTMRSFSSLDKRWVFIELLAVFVGLILVTWRYLKVTQREKK